MPAEVAVVSGHPTLLTDVAQILTSSAGKTGREDRMKEPYDEMVANHIGPESCAAGEVR